MDVVENGANELRHFRTLTAPLPGGCEAKHRYFSKCAKFDVTLNRKNKILLYKIGTFQNTAGSKKHATSNF